MYKEGEVLCVLYAKLGITPPRDAKPVLNMEARMAVLEQHGTAWPSFLSKRMRRTPEEARWLQQVAVLLMETTLRDCPKHGKPADDARQTATSRTQGPK